MGSATEHLRAWRVAGLLDADAAARIEAFEAGRAADAGDDSPGVLEAIVYLGVAVATVGALVLVISNWTSLSGGFRAAVPAVSALLALAAGQVLRLGPRNDLRRGGRVAWLAGGVLATVAMAVAGNEAGWAGEDTALAAAGVALAFGGALWFIERSAMQLIGVSASLVLLSLALTARTDGHETAIAGLLVALFATAQLALVEMGWLRPKIAGRVLGAAGLAAGAYSAQFNDAGWLQAMVFVAGVGLMAASIRFAALVYMAFGVAAVFAGLITVILRNVSDPTAAALALVVLGAILVGGVLGLAKLRPWRRARTATKPG